MSNELLYEEDEEAAGASPLEAWRHFQLGRLPIKTSKWGIPAQPEAVDVLYLLPSGVPLLHSLESTISSHIVEGWATIFGAPSTHALDDVISAARTQLLALGHNWDDAGGQPFEASTIDRATGLLKRLFAVLLTRGGELPLPAISPADGSSVDLYWTDSGRTLLVNVPQDPNAPATFSGRSGIADTIAGRIDLNQGRIAHLAAWLSE